MSGFGGRFWALLGPFLTPLGLSVGPNVYILSFWRYQNHLDPNEKLSGDPRNVILYNKTLLRKTRFFYPKIGLFAHKLGQNGVHWGVYRVNFGFLRVPDPLRVEIMQKEFFEKNILAYFGPKGLRKISGLPPQK